MRRSWRGILQIALLVGVIAVLVRFFPVAIQFIEAAALGIRTFWWLILILALGFWFIWTLRKRNPG